MASAAPGILFLYLLDAVLLAIPVSLTLMWFYRRAIERAMLATATASETEPALATTRDMKPVNAPTLVGWERRARLRLALVYGLAGASASAFWTWLFFRAPDIQFTWIRAFTAWYSYCWPVPATLIALLAISWRQSLAVIGAYILAGMLGIAALSALPHLGTNLRAFFLFLALQALLPVLVILIVSNRRIRGVSPLALAGLLVFTFSSVGAREIFARLVDVGGLRKPLLTIGLNWWFMLAAVPVGYVCWLLLAFLNAKYRRKSFSDAQLLADSFWVVAAFFVSIGYASDSGWQGLVGLGGFVVYRAMAQFGLFATRDRQSQGRGMRLLVLRVFGFRARTEKLFDSVAQRWRFRGSVAMIAGTDLAARTINPDDTLAFLAGDLRSRFVQGQRDLEEQLKAVDESPDPDGRFRVAEFFCHENTWPATLAALLERSDAILMDLRGFSEKNAGCVFELGQLVTQNRIGDTVFIVDAATNFELLQAIAGTGNLHLERVESGTASERERVYRSLAMAAAA